MADEKKVAPRRKRTTTARKTTRKRPTKANVGQSSEGFSLSKEVKGLIVIAFGIVALIGFFGIKVGIVGEFLTGIFQYGFGLGGIIPCLAWLYAGWRLLYSGSFISFTKRGVLFTLFFIFLMALVPLWRVPAGQELYTVNLLNQGGFIGGLVAMVLRTIVGEIGSIILDVILLIALGMLIFRLSLSKGLHKAKDTAQVGVDVAKVGVDVAKDIAAEQAQVMKDAAAEKAREMKTRLEDWNEQRKVAAAERRAYNRERDTRFEEVADSAKAALAERGFNVESHQDNVTADSTVNANDVNPYARNMDTTVDSVVSAPSVSASVESASIEPVETVTIENTSVPSVENIAGPSTDDYVVGPMSTLNNSDFGDTNHVYGDNNAFDVVEPEIEAIPVDDTFEPLHDIETVTSPTSAINYGVPESYDSGYDDFDDTNYDDEYDEFDNHAPTEEKPFVRRSLIESGEGDVRTVDAVPIAPIAPIVPIVPSIEGTEEDTAAVAVSTEGKIHRSIEREYHFPSLEILAKGEVSQVASEEVAHNASLLETTLKSFGITARVVNATQGPAVTRYELEPAPGTKVSKIVNLTDDLKLSLAAADIRMEAPIPGKSAIGIEVPNKSISAVHLRDVLDCDDFKGARGGIPVGLGKDIAGKPIITDLAKMPHLLVAGSTGSGKSVCINTLISSILFSRKPEEVKLILIDPKMVELSTYNGIPHLMAPVVTDMKKAAAVLRWAVREMEARYRTFAATGVRDVKRYNELHPKTAMPLVLIIIDELADLMMTAPADIEESISRLAQMARAAGLHMVLATQRPSVNVITGTIKANVPSRISFAVATQIDSRTILDMAGAEKLLGKGDMLFAPIGANKPVRIQGAFISDDEVEHLVFFVKAQRQPEYDDTVTEAEEKEEAKEEKKEEEFRDELLERAVDLVMDSGQASVSMLQRRFRIGYTRAARLVDTMEDLKIVGPNVGSKARDILMSHAQVKEKYFPQSSNTEGEGN